MSICVTAPSPRLLYRFVERLLSWGSEFSSSLRRPSHQAISDWSASQGADAGLMSLEWATAVWLLEWFESRISEKHAKRYGLRRGTVKLQPDMLRIVLGEKSFMEATEAHEVTILVHTANDWARSVIRGVAHFAQEYGRWKLFLEPRGFHERLSLPEKWTGDGVILRLTYDELRRSIETRRVPAVNVSWMGHHHPRIPKVVSDQHGCAQLAVEHLQSKGFESIAYVGPNPNLGYDDAILRSCQTLLSPDVCESIFPAGNKSARRECLRGWVERLPTPTGILVWDSEGCRDLLQVCSQLSRTIPEELGIVCIEHDHLITSVADTPLTSIDQNPARVGYEAARQLAAMMDGAPAPTRPTLIRPLGIVCRQSTDRLAAEDALVVAALQYVQQNFAAPIQVRDLCDALKISRRQLEDRFRNAIRSSPAKEIRRIRLDHVKRMLVETDFQLERVASQSGFEHAEVMMRAFKRAFGETAGEYRRLR